MENKQGYPGQATTVHQQKVKTSMWHLVAKQDNKQGALEKDRTGRTGNNYQKKKVEVVTIKV